MDKGDNNEESGRVYCLSTVRCQDMSKVTKPGT